MFNNKEDKKVLEEISSSTTTISKGTVLQGSVETFGNLRVEGKIVGNIKSKSKVVLSESAVLDGNLVSQNAEIAGEIKGIVEVSDILVLKPTAIVHGDIITGKLVVESGATFNGNCKMGSQVTNKKIEIGEPAAEITKKAIAEKAA
jgi:cytoskeletal protein CcmA (bactofilin family)